MKLSSGKHKNNSYISFYFLMTADEAIKRKTNFKKSRFFCILRLLKEV